MLDSKTIEIVQSTAPVLKQHSEQIGKKFYELLFAKAPDLYNLFNQTNQKRGLQQEALGYAVYAAGEHITNLDAIMPVITRVTQKHRAIGVKPEQYPLVGETLLEAVKEVLGSAATDDIIGAWGKAYEYIADAFIQIEQDLYKEAKEQAGGWEGFRSFTVTRKVAESDDVTSFYLEPSDTQALAGFEPGQYLTIKAEVPGEKYKHIRHYSLSDAPGKSYYRISVKREHSNEGKPAGIVSNDLHDRVQEGDSLLFSAPAGDFTLDHTNDHLVLIGGGIGVTPLMSMINTVADQSSGREVTFVQAAANGNNHPFKEHLAGLANSHPNLRCFTAYSSPTEQDLGSESFSHKGFVDAEWLRSILPSGPAVYYFCGSVSFMKAIHQALKELEIPKERIHYEAFSPIAILDEE
ncbi:nitric oxide dioxygenase [Paenibacillus favisporus]|uniref:Flavohemoprotein n=1 Tax=Paenibacillus favisporus TaxID=221028 RepID=A0ABV2EX43_9BACL